MAEPVPKLWVGVDWATQAHQVCMLDAGGGVRGERAIPATGQGLFDLVKHLRQMEPGDPSGILVAIEVNHGSVVETP